MLLKNMSGRAVLIAGIASATLFLLANAILATFLEAVTVTVVLRYMASLVLGTDVLTNATTTTLLIGAGVHYALSLLFALIIAVVVHRWGLLVGIIGGGLLGLAIYGINFYTMTRWFPYFFAISSPTLIISHVLFGAMTGGIYESFDHYDEPFLSEEAAT